MQRRRSYAWLVLVLTLCSCASRGSSVPATEPSIVGRITALDRAGERIGHVRVETEPAERAGSAKAVVRITQGTEILRGDSTRADFAALALGQWVRVWFVGPVAESYPVQATAGVVAIDSAGR